MSERDFESDGKEAVVVKERTDVEEPPMYKVVLLNDNYSTMEFVVFILESVFKKTSREAEEIMLTVHQRGSGVAGIYPKDVAETKISIVHHLAKSREYPLKCIMEQE